MFNSILSIAASLENGRSLHRGQVTALHPVTKTKEFVCADGFDNNAVSCGVSVFSHVVFREVTLELN